MNELSFKDLTLRGFLKEILGGDWQIVDFDDKDSQTLDRLIERNPELQSSIAHGHFEAINLLPPEKFSLWTVQSVILLYYRVLHCPMKSLQSSRFEFRAEFNSPEGKIITVFGGIHDERRISMFVM